jgi:hypothetical protein
MMQSISAAGKQLEEGKPDHETLYGQSVLVF